MSINLRSLSLGAGVQSTTIGLLIVEGVLPMVDNAIFADTGWEPAQVYTHLDRLAPVLAAAGIELYRVAAGNIRLDATDPTRRFATPPWFIRNPDGSQGKGMRQCTSEYKLEPIRRKLRELLGAKAPNYRSVPRGNTAEQWVGFSTDEIGRVSDKVDVRYLTRRHPLLDLGMSRRDCIRFLGTRTAPDGMSWARSVTKSACIGCPFHGNRAWRQMRDERPDEFADAVAYDALIRKGGARGEPLRGEAFLHRSMLPLAQAPIDRIERKEYRAGQVDIFDAVADAEAGYDPDEDGDPDGCSPYGCRSGEPVESAR